MLDGRQRRCVSHLRSWRGDVLGSSKNHNTALAVFQSVCYTYHDFRGESRKAVARQSGATLLATRAAAFAFSLPLSNPYGSMSIVGVEQTEKT